jgi:hypothetical protein
MQFPRVSPTRPCEEKKEEEEEEGEAIASVLPK